MSSKVERFTTQYHPLEDRMRFSVQFGDGTIQVLWLTRRLLDRLVARLVTYLDRAPLPGGADSNPVKTRVQQRFNQQAATASITPQKPVRVNRPEQQTRPSALVAQVGLRPTRTVLHLDFKSDSTSLAQIPFHKDALRQWLSVLYTHYQAANWSSGIWPDWIKPEVEAVQSAESPGQRMN